VDCVDIFIVLRLIQAWCLFGGGVFPERVFSHKSSVLMCC